MTETKTFKPAIRPAARRTPGNRRSLRQSIRDSLVMAYRGLLKMRRTPEQFFDVTLQPIVFTLIFIYIFGGAISGDVLSYLPIIIPGTLVQTVLTTSASTGVMARSTCCMSAEGTPTAPVAERKWNPQNRVMV